MIQLIALIIFVVSLGGVLLILIRKMPVLVELSQNGKTGIRNHHVILNIENRIKKIFVLFEKQIFWHKFLSWVRCLVIKIEVQIDHLLRRIRRKAQQVDKDIKK